MAGEPAKLHFPELAFPPSVNAYWRRVGHQTILSARARAYRKIIGSQAFTPPKSRMDGPLFVRIVFYPPDKRRRDLDNLPKGLFDAMKYAGVYGDDSQIHRIDMRWGIVVKGGRADVLILTLDPLRGADD